MLPASKPFVHSSTSSAPAAQVVGKHIGERVDFHRPTDLDSALAIRKEAHESKANFRIQLGARQPRVRSLQRRFVCTCREVRGSIDR